MTGITPGGGITPQSSTGQGEKVKGEEKKGQIDQGKKAVTAGKSNLKKQEEEAVLQKLPTTADENKAWVKKQISRSPEERVSPKIKAFQDKILTGKRTPSEEEPEHEKENRDEKQEEKERPQDKEIRREQTPPPSRTRTPEPHAAPAWVKESIAREAGVSPTINRLQQQVSNEASSGKMPDLPLGDDYHKEKIAQAKEILRNSGIDKPTTDQIQNKANELIKQDIERHRNPPKMTGPSAYDSSTITDKMNPIINKKIEAYQKANAGDFIAAPRDKKTGKMPSVPDDKVIDPKNFEAQRRFIMAKSKFKEEACLEVYGAHINQNVKDGWYNPKVIVEEMKSNLGVTDDIPKNIALLTTNNPSLTGKDGKPNKELLSAIEKQLSDELDDFTFRFEKTPDGQLTTNQLLSKDGKERIMHELEHVLKSYAKAFPNKRPEDVYLLCRDMARMAVYQGIYDRKSFTGSDHTEKHIHHNCENGAKIKKQMVADGKKMIEDGNQLIQQGKIEEGRGKISEGTKMVQDAEISAKDSLIMRVMHFYHDLGYSVGTSGKSFKCAKDHPFIGAKFIEENKAYFERLMDTESTDALHKAVLQHAIVSFDSTPTAGRNDVHLNMIRFITSNSDACAVTFDQKTQSFFFENPQTIQALARLKLFVTIFPQYGEFNKKLANSDVVKMDKTTMAAVAGLDPNNKLDKAAMEIFLATRDSLLDAANQKDIPANDKKAFVEAIMNQFNSLSGDIVLAQYGAKLTGVGVAINPDFDPKDPKKGPKYLTQVEMAPSAMYGVLNSLYGQDTAGKNIVKLCNEEYGCDKNKLNEFLDTVGKALAGKQFLDPKATIKPLEIQAPGANIRIVPKPSLDPKTDAGAVQMATSLERLNLHTDVAKIRNSVTALTLALERLSEGKSTIQDVTDWNNELLNAFSYKPAPGMMDIAHTFAAVEDFVTKLRVLTAAKMQMGTSFTKDEVNGLITDLNEVVARSANARFEALVGIQ